MIGSIFTTSMSIINFFNCQTTCGFDQLSKKMKVNFHSNQMQEDYVSLLVLFKETLA